jgi:hypothetical protein
MRFLKIAVASLAMLLVSSSFSRVEAVKASRLTSVAVVDHGDIIFAYNIYPDYPYDGCHDGDKYCSFVAEFCSYDPLPDGGTWFNLVFYNDVTNMSTNTEWMTAVWPDGPNEFKFLSHSSGSHNYILNSESDLNISWSLSEYTHTIGSIYQSFSGNYYITWVYATLTDDC